MIKINGMISFKAKVISIEHDKVYLLLEDGCMGLLYFYELPNYQADLSYIFDIGQMVYVRKKQILFTGTVLVTLKGLLEKDSIEDLSGEECYGITCKELAHGILFQLTSNLQICLYGIYLPSNTKILVSLRQNKNGRIKAYLSSIIYDEFIIEPIFSLQYKNIEIYEDNQLAA